jgi:hypothetical protein
MQKNETAVQSYAANSNLILRRSTGKGGLIADKRNVQ